MQIVEQVGLAVQQTLTVLAKQAGISCGIIQRNRKFDEESLAQTMVFGYLQNPQASDESLAQMAGLCGVSVTPQAIAQRFTWLLVEFLETLLKKAVKQLVADQPVAIALLKRFNGVYVQDSSTIALPAELADRFPGSGGAASTAAVKVQTRLNLLTGGLDYVDLEPGRNPDQGSAMQQAPLPAGALRLADLGFFSVTVLALLARQSVYWISRIQSATAVFSTAGERLELHRWLPTHVTCGVVEMSIELGSRERLPCRLFAFRVPDEVAARRRQRLHEDTRRKGRSPSQQRLQWCQWTVYVTNVEPERLTAQEILVLYRARWQIELLFKLWKSHGLLGTTTRSQPVHQAVEVFARLLAVTVQHWLLVAGVWQFADRSLVKAARIVRGFVPSLAMALHYPDLLIKQLATMRASLAKTARINPRKRKPNTYQLLLKPELLDYALT